MADDEAIASVRERLGMLLRTSPVGDRVVALEVVKEHVKALVGTDAATDERDQRPEISHVPQDWMHTLDAVQRAGEALRAREERITALETELNELRAESSEAVASLQAHVSSLQEQLASMDERRAHAEQWLRRLHEAVVEKLRVDHPIREEEGSRRTG